MKPWVWYSAPQTSDVVVHTCTPSTWDVEAEGELARGKHFSGTSTGSPFYSEMDLVCWGGRARETRRWISLTIMSKSVSVWWYMHMNRDQKRVTDTLELEFWAVMNCLTWVSGRELGPLQMKSMLLTTWPSLRSWDCVLKECLCVIGVHWWTNGRNDNQHSED